MEQALLYAQHLSNIYKNILLAFNCQKDSKLKCPRPNPVKYSFIARTWILMMVYTYIYEILSEWNRLEEGT
jgi:hypothetical protein